MQTKSFKGKVALVTGGSRGIGAGIVRRLAADGASVAFTYSSSPEKALELVREIESAGGKALALKADSGSALAAVRNALVTFAQRKDLSSAEGCMGLNAISEFGQRDAGVTRITRNAGRRQRQTLMRVLTRAKKQREIRSDADLDSMADFFESTLAGIRMAAKAGKSRHALRNIAAFASRAYLASDRRITPDGQAGSYQLAQSG